MGVMLQVRNLPEEVHARLKERAAQERMSLSDYVANELAKLVEYRSNREIIEEFRRKHPDIRLRPGEAAEDIRAAREERDEELAERLAASETRRNKPSGE